MPLLPGSHLGRFEVVSVLGAGGMGEVFRARDSRLQRDVAIKVVSATFSHDPERAARFEREAQLLAALNHPNIASVYGLEHGRIALPGHGTRRRRHAWRARSPTRCRPHTRKASFTAI